MAKKKKKRTLKPKYLGTGYARKAADEAEKRRKRIEAMLKKL